MRNFSIFFTLSSGSFTYKTHTKHRRINKFSYLIIHALYICLFDVRLPENDLKKTETRRIISEE